MDKKEAFSRVVIDRKLREAGWNIESSEQVVFEDHGSAGRADYILRNSSGDPIALIEAKAPKIDPYTAKEQARNYVEAQYKGKIRYIYLANDHVIYFWDIARGDAIQVEELYSQRDLERKHTAEAMGNVIPLSRELITEDYLTKADPNNYSLRHYQVEAINTIASEYDEGKRAFLLEMATGTGKTGLAAALIRKFLETHQAQNILFIVDRIALATQTKGAFEPILKDLSTIATFWGSSKNNIVGANVVVATIQSLISHGEKYFSPGYFDLIIHDEAHRSIYSPQARSATARFYGATKVGLTATPKDFLKNVEIEKLQINDPRRLEARLQRDTYEFFGCPQGKATYQYTILDGVNDPRGPFLVAPKYHKMTSVLTQSALNPEGLQVSEAAGETFRIKDLEKKLFLKNRNEIMMREFLEYAEEAPDGEIGKTIIFAVSQRHALELERILNALKPEYGGQFAKTITSQVANAQHIAKEFKDPENQRMRVAVSVDMLTTGFDCPEILNIVLARPIFEPTLYQQIKGRGTRLWEFEHEGKKFKKNTFTIFDFCGVVEYFEEEYDWSVPLTAPRTVSSNTVQDASDSRYRETPTGDSKLSELRRAFSPIESVAQDAPIKRDVVSVGPDGDEVDKHMYQSKWEQVIQEMAKKDKEIQEMAENEERHQELLSYLDENILNKPTEYFSESKLQEGYGIMAPIITFVRSALHLEKLPSREKQLREWQEGMIQKYAITPGAKQGQTLMAKLLFEKVITEPNLRESVETSAKEENLSFLAREPFNAYRPNEWIETFGQENLSEMAQEISTSKVLTL